MSSIKAQNEFVLELLCFSCGLQGAFTEHNQTEVLMNKPKQIFPPFSSFIFCYFCQPIIFYYTMTQTWLLPYQRYHSSSIEGVTSIEKLDQSVPKILSNSGEALSHHDFDVLHFFFRRETHFTQKLNMVTDLFMVQ